MKTILPFLCLFFPALLFSQTKLPQKQLQLIAGTSQHGSGDLGGIAFSGEYARYFRKSLTYSVALTGTIHDGSSPVIYTDLGGNQTDGSVRYTTAGIQTASHLGLSVVRTKSHEVQFRAGALLRYQSSSLPGSYAITYQETASFQYPVVNFIQQTPQRTFSVGWSSQLVYNFTLSNKLSLGVLGGIQNDTNGDTIPQLSLTVGKRF